MQLMVDDPEEARKIGLQALADKFSQALRSADPKRKCAKCRKPWHLQFVHIKCDRTDAFIPTKEMCVSVAGPQIVSVPFPVVKDGEKTELHVQRWHSNCSLCTSCCLTDVTCHHCRSSVRLHAFPSNSQQPSLSRGRSRVSGSAHVSRSRAHVNSSSVHLWCKGPRSKVRWPHSNRAVPSPSATCPRDASKWCSSRRGTVACPLCGMSYMQKKDGTHSKPYIDHVIGGKGCKSGARLFVQPQQDGTATQRVSAAKAFDQKVDASGNMDSLCDCEHCQSHFAPFVRKCVEARVSGA